MQKYKTEVEAADALAEKYQELKAEIGKVIIGQEDVIDKLLIALFCKGHSLLVGVPGLAKTLLISTVAKVLDLEFNRIQFTPDLMPSDILGTEILEVDEESNRKAFKFVKGPIFANIILADEINRTPPKTQAALLEAMQEKKVTVAGVNHKLDAPFFVLATQNPIEQEGTYPLPEAQLDRFMFNIQVEYPSIEEEIQIVKRTTSNIVPEIKPILSKDDILYFQNLVRQVPVTDNVVAHSVNLVNKTRINTPHASEEIKELITWGAGPRASQYLILGAKAVALLRGKYAPDIEDVNAVAKSVLRHRIVASFTAEAEGISPDDIIEKLL
ncbi:MoxR family ATPase [Pontibacter sp. G13]|uniref:AAA family ATPase n=1 Tax=Pontibacter sp. G13 TaxID=3074898 RepID=UPI00288929B3|nr:MoxR family ATPase [Pontibacter sp. G13]WNJ21195.1 MoxR family ATPase [Pontibacter sp. G13]